MNDTHRDALGTGSEAGELGACGLTFSAYDFNVSTQHFVYVINATHFEKHTTLSWDFFTSSPTTFYAWNMETFLATDGAKNTIITPVGDLGVPIPLFTLYTGITSILKL